MGARWIDLLDPSDAELERALPRDLHPRALDQLREPFRHGHEPRPTLERHGEYVFGVLLAPAARPARGDVYYREIDLILTRDLVVTVRKTPTGEAPFDCSDALALDEGGDLAAGMIGYRIVDCVADAYLDLVDDLDGEIDELEDHVEEWTDDAVRGRISELRHDLLHIRQTLSPTRDAVRRVFDGRVDTAGAEIFDRDVELHFVDAYDKLLRAFEGLELARDLLASARDYHMAKVANDQNEVMKRLAAVASLLLVPTFIVGLYGQNFDELPEFHWRLGYAWSWLLIAVTTAFQLWYFRRKRWL